MRIIILMHTVVTLSDLTLYDKVFKALHFIFTFKVRKIEEGGGGLYKFNSLST